MEWSVVSKAADRSLAVGYGPDDGVVEREQNRFSRVEPGVCRLEFVEERIVVEVLRQTDGS